MTDSHPNCYPEGDEPLTNIERVRLALAMADAGYKWEVESEYVEALLKAYDDLNGVARAGKVPDLRPPSPDFRVVPVRVLQSAYDRIDAMLASIEPDLRAANAVRIELRHLINEAYAVSSTHSRSGERP